MISCENCYFLKFYLHVFSDHTGSYSCVCADKCKQFESFVTESQYKEIEKNINTVYKLSDNNICYFCGSGEIIKRGKVSNSDTSPRSKWSFKCKGCKSKYNSRMSMVDKKRIFIGK